MRHDEIQELLGAYALDAVEPGERTEIDDHLRECARCRAEVAEHRDTAGFLAFAGTDAPDAVWDRIAGSIDAPNVVPMAPKLGFGARRARSRWPQAVTLVGAAAAVVIGVLVIQLRGDDGRIDPLNPETFSAAMQVKGARVAHLTAGDTELPIVVTPDGRAWLEASALPALADGRTYQLWGMSDGEAISLGVLGRDPRTVSFDSEGYAGLAITEEQSPGVVRSENPPVASGSLA
jgi:anti-sigma factor RsiW